MSLSEKLENLVKKANYAYGEGGIVGKDYKKDMKKDDSKKSDDKKEDKKEDGDKDKKDGKAKFLEMIKAKKEGGKDKSDDSKKEESKKEDMKKEGKAKLLSKLFRRGSEEAIKKTTPKLLRKERMKGLAMGGGAAVAGTGAAAYASSDKGKAHISKMKQKFSKKAGIVGATLKGGAAMTAGAMGYKHKDKVIESAKKSGKWGKGIYEAVKKAPK